MSTSNSTEAESTTAQQPFTLEELEVFLNNELNNSQIHINEDLLNCSSSSSIEPTDTNKLNAIALAMTKTLRENINLRSDIDALQKRVDEQEINQVFNSFHCYDSER